MDPQVALYKYQRAQKMGICKCVCVCVRLGVERTDGSAGKINKSECREVDKGK